jgi:hypothetical protein
MPNPANANLMIATNNKEHVVWTSATTCTQPLHLSLKTNLSWTITACP